MHSNSNRSRFLFDRTRIICQETQFYQVIGYEIRNYKKLEVNMLWIHGERSYGWNLISEFPF